jgi:hypothetical protein
MVFVHDGAQIPYVWSRFLTVVCGFRALPNANLFPGQRGIRSVRASTITNPSVGVGFHDGGDTLVDIWEA